MRGYRVRMPESMPRPNGRTKTMPRGGPGRTEVLHPGLDALLGSAGVADLEDMIAGLDEQGADRPVPPSRRRPRRELTVTYRVRVELPGTDPLVWRRIELASDVTLDRLHDLLQTVMGWTDSHLHQFGSGDDVDDPNAEYYLLGFAVEDGAAGVDERTVRLDEVLVEPGDRLWYEYDLGDGWTHTIDVEEVLPRDRDAPVARCLTGAGACPPEDCGGVWGYAELLEVLAGPPGPELDELRTWLRPGFDPASFDVDAVNAALSDGHGRTLWGILPVDPDSPLGALTERMDGYVPSPMATALDTLRAPAPEVSAADRAGTVRPFSLLLERVGREGIALTPAGYLPPVHVRELCAELGVDKRWIGKGNREAQTLPVLYFRESAQQLGLLRKARNRLSLTKAGLRALEDPDFLWQHIAVGLPLTLTKRGPQVAAVREAGSLLLLGLAAGLRTTERTELVAAGLNAGRWYDGQGNPLTPSHARGLTGPTSTVLEYMKLVPSLLRRGSDADPPVSDVGVAFARAALGLPCGPYGSVSEPDHDR